MPLRLGRVGVEAISSFDGRRMVYYEGHGRKGLESRRAECLIWVCMYSLSNSEIHPLDCVRGAWIFTPSSTTYMCSISWAMTSFDYRNFLHGWVVQIMDLHS